jgi:VanZ family protein
LLRKYLFFFLLAYSFALWGANQLWYKHHDFNNFHWFDDLAEWQQMDKLGHIFTAFHLSSFVFIALYFIEKKKVILSSFIGFVLLSSIEILDGFSAAYGASAYDLVANFLGAFLFAFQKMGLFVFLEHRLRQTIVRRSDYRLTNQNSKESKILFENTFIQPKFSFHFTNFAIQRPNVLGNSWIEQLLKDYNGQTYWYAIPIRFFPAWLGLAVGYSASNMLFGRVPQNEAVGIYPFRRYFISFDINLLALKSRYRFINSLVFLTNLVRLPLPALEWNENEGFVWHWIYF